MEKKKEVNPIGVGMSGGDSIQADVQKTTSHDQRVEIMDAKVTTKTGMTGGKAVNSIVAAEIHGDVGCITSNAEDGASVVNIAGCPGAAITLEQETISGSLSQNTLKRRIDNMNQTFIQTLAFEDAKVKLQDDGHVILSGAPGDGKTVIALKFCDEYQKKGFYIAFVERMDQFDVNECTGRKARILLVLDDVFKYLEQRALHEENIFKILESQVGKGETDLKVIITAKSYNLKEGLSRLPHLKIKLFRADVITDLLSLQFTTSERSDLIATLTNNHKTEALVTPETKCDIIEMKSLHFGFPRICSIYFQYEHFERSTLEYFENPITYVRETLDVIIHELGNQAALLTLLVMTGDHADLRSLKQLKIKGDKCVSEIFDELQDVIPTWTWTGLQRAADNFDGTYLTVQDGSIQFAHPSVYDAVSCALGSLNPQLIVTYCSQEFLRKRVKLRKVGEMQSTESDDINNIIVLAPVFGKELMERLKGQIYSNG